MFAFHCPFESASTLVLHFHSSHQEIRYRIVINEKYKKLADLHCSHRDFQVVDLVMVRLHVRSLRLYKVLNNIGPNVCVLDIPTTLEIDPIFFVEILVSYHSHSIPDPQPSTVTQTLVFQSTQPMPLLPSVIACREEIEVMLEDQLIYTRWEVIRDSLSSGKAGQRLTIFV